MKTLYLTIITISTIFLIIHYDEVFAQNIQGKRCCGGAEAIPQADIGNRTIGVSFVASTLPDSINVTNYLQFRVYDKNTNTTIRHVSSLITISKDNKTVLNELFHTHSGFLDLYLQGDKDSNGWSVSAGHEPILNGWVSENGLPIVVKIPMLKEGWHHLNFTIFSIDRDNSILDTSNAPRFDFWFYADNHGKISEYGKSMNGVIPITSVQSDGMPSPLQQLKARTLSKLVKCNYGLNLLINGNNFQPACVKETSTTRLLNQGWILPSQCITGPVNDRFTMDVLGEIIIPKNASYIDSGKTYEPQNATVVIGLNNTVEWINMDDFESSVISNQGVFDSGLILPGHHWRYTFECAGKYEYHSVPHPWMRGAVTVLPFGPK